MSKAIKTILLAVVLMITASVNATVRTVSNAGGAQYSNLRDGFIACSNGDTLMVQGSASSYSMVDAGGGWSKDLVVIGTGYNSPKQVFNPTTFTISPVYNCGSCFSISGNGSSKFYGITFLDDVYLTAISNNLIFDGCVFTKQFNTNYYSGSQAITNAIFRNCIFKDNASAVSVSIGGYANTVLFSHCIFSNNIYGNNNSTTFNVNFEHCVFIKNTGIYFGGVYNPVLNNCIFYGNADIGGINNAVFNNCSSLITTTGWSSSGNSAINCLNTTDPLFVSAPVGSVYSNALDFHLQTGSTAIGAASDGTDLGLYGGTLHFSVYGEPLTFPVVRQLQIQNTSVPANGNVNVKVRSTKAR